MATGLLSPIGILVQQLTNAGQPLSGGLVNTYVAGTTTPVTTYTDSTLGVANANPIVLNSAGRLPNSVWVPAGTPHKLVLTDANSVTLSTIDQLNGINDPALINQVNSQLPTGAGTANAQTITNVAAITSQAKGVEQWYSPGIANTGDTTVNVDGLGALHCKYLSKTLVGGELQVGVPVILKSDGTFWNLAWSASGLQADYYVDTGSVNSIAVTVNMSQTAPANGMRVKVLVQNTTTTGSATLNINGLSAQPIILSDGSNAPAGSIIGSKLYEFVISPGGAQLINPSSVTGSFTITLTGMTSATTGTVNYRISSDGKIVVITIPSNITGTSNATTMTGTGIPLIIAIGSSSGARMILLGQDSGNSNAILVSGLNGTTWTFVYSLAIAVFTNTGTKGLNGCIGTYST